MGAHRTAAVSLGVLTLIPAMPPPAMAGSPKTNLVSVTSAGDPVPGTDQLVISGNGLFVAFQANANALPGMDGVTDVYVHDVEQGKTRLVSKTSTGAWADGPSLFPSLSGDGSQVAFRRSRTTFPPGTAALSAPTSAIRTRTRPS